MGIPFSTGPHREERQMHRRAVTTAVAPSPCDIALRAISVTILVLILVTWSSSASADSTVFSNTLSGETGDNPTPNPTGIIDEDTADGDNAANESVTMSIPLEEDGVIRVEAPPMGVKIEKWSGDDVLVIVEKKKRAKVGGQSNPIDPVNIQITRKGKDVRIETTGGSNWRESGVDLSFRIVLPERYQAGIKTDDDTDGVSRLTNVLWRAVHREALRWVTR
jgi:hypothetical protein